MRDVTPPTPNQSEIRLPAEANASEVADFARGVAVLERLAKRVAELARADDKESGQ